MFLFTGVMAYGPRKSFEVLVLERGGEIAMGVSKKVHYLMVGEIGNDQWLHSTYGKKKSKKLWSYERIVRRSRLSASSTGKRRCSARPPGDGIWRRLLTSPLAATNHTVSLPILGLVLHWGERCHT